MVPSRIDVGCTVEQLPTAADDRELNIELFDSSGGSTGHDIQIDYTVTADVDGVLDGDDLCPDTGEGQLVDADDCSVADLCPTAAAWRDHGAYVSCVPRTAEDFVDEGLLTEDEAGAMVRTAAPSSARRRP